MQCARFPICTGPYLLGGEAPYTGFKRNGIAIPSKSTMLLCQREGAGPRTPTPRPLAPTYTTTEEKKHPVARTHHHHHGRVEQGSTAQEHTD